MTAALSWMKKVGSYPGGRRFSPASATKNPPDYVKKSGGFLYTFSGEIEKSVYTVYNTSRKIYPLEREEDGHDHRRTETQNRRHLGDFLDGNRDSGYS